jgi:hypothetical protein
MNFSLEDAVNGAKLAAKSAGSKGIGVTKYEEYLIIAIDFTNPANNAPGPKKTGMQIQSNSVIDSGMFRADTAIVGAFNVQLDGADVLATQTNSADNARSPLTTAANNTADPKELIVNVTAAASAGLGVIIGRVLPF